MANNTTNKTKKKDLTLLQKNFCREYLKDFNATRAYKRAGYSTVGKGSEVSACRLLKNVKVKAELQRLTDKLAKKQELSAEWVLKNLKEISARSMEKEHVKYFDKSSKEYVDETKLVRNLETEELEEVYVYKYDSNGAIRANELIGKHLGMFTDKMEISGETTQNVKTDNEDLSKLSNKELKQLISIKKKMSSDE